ncbi:MAG: YidC/Oxa1 family membrane protein insertase [Oscillospiraceae bacterium]|nr:YidC/Oxa1 family membrane protein insertase [Oscillospiraceae bacterium]
MFRNLIAVPFGYLLDILNRLTSNYGVALILFAILVKVILLPLTAKGKKSMMKMSRITPRVQALQKKYAGDQQKQNEAIQALYKQEGVSMGGGCLWSFLPILFLFPVYWVIREPLQYMLHLEAGEINIITNIVKAARPGLIGESSAYYSQLLVAPEISGLANEIQNAIPNISSQALEGLKFNFLGINLSQDPAFLGLFGGDWAWNWKNIGCFLIPVLSASSQILHTLVTQKLNNSVVTDKNGIVDEETAKKGQNNKAMMWLGPAMSLWIGFTVPAALSLYWLVQGLASIVIDIYLTKKYRKIYDAEDAERLKEYLAQEALEAEKERLRAEKRAANPEGITTNTSKKKLQQKKQAEEAAAKAAAAKEYAASKGIEIEEPKKENLPLSGIPSRPHCKGRAYDPNRYSRESTEE